MYAVQASITYLSPSGTESTRQLPTFYLDPDVQGITSDEQAISIAYEVVDAFGAYGGEGDVHIGVSKL